MPQRYPHRSTDWAKWSKEIEELIHCCKGQFLNMKQALTACSWETLFGNQGEIETTLRIVEGTEPFKWPIIPSENDRLLNAPGCRISCEQLFFEYSFFIFHSVEHAILLACSMSQEFVVWRLQDKAAQRIAHQPRRTNRSR